MRSFRALPTKDNVPIQQPGGSTDGSGSRPWYFGFRCCDDNGCDTNTDRGTVSVKFLPLFGVLPRSRLLPNWSGLCIYKLSSTDNSISASLERRHHPGRAHDRRTARRLCRRLAYLWRKFWWRLLSERLRVWDQQLYSDWKHDRYRCCG